MLGLDKMAIDPRLLRLLRLGVGGVFAAIVGVLLGFLSDLSGLEWVGKAAVVLTVGGVGLVFIVGALGCAVAISALFRKSLRDSRKH